VERVLERGCGDGGGRNHGGKGQGDLVVGESGNPDENKAVHRWLTLGRRIGNPEEEVLRCDMQGLEQPLLLGMASCESGQRSELLC